jgi:hypothetical protein
MPEHGWTPLERDLAGPDLVVDAEDGSPGTPEVSCLTFGLTRQSGQEALLRGDAWGKQTRSRLEGGNGGAICENAAP